MLRTIAGHLEQHAVPGHGRLRVVAEQPLGLRDDADVRAYMRYEAASNVLYRRFDASVLCPYDAARLPDDILRAALRTHPELVETRATRHSELFMDPRAFIRLSAHDTPPPPTAAHLPLESAADVAAARGLVRAQAHAVGLPPESIDDLAVAVSEVATNALVHGRAPRGVWTFVGDGRLICRIADAGSGPPDPLAGYLPPLGDALGGQGLWAAHQLCDIVEVAGDATRTDVYLRTRLPDAA
jgi:anti-sigma regulatory factor (Ser/Thr protein kinase)